MSLSQFITPNPQVEGGCGVIRSGRGLGQETGNRRKSEDNYALGKGHAAFGLMALASIPSSRSDPRL
jgi:hypothetical protein